MGGKMRYIDLITISSKPSMHHGKILTDGGRATQSKHTRYMVAFLHATPTPNPSFSHIRVINVTWSTIVRKGSVELIKQQLLRCSYVPHQHKLAHHFEGQARCDRSPSFVVHVSLEIFQNEVDLLGCCSSIWGKGKSFPFPHSRHDSLPTAMQLRIAQ